MSLSKRFILILGLVNLLIWGFLLWPKRPELIVTFLDVGEGDSVFIKFPWGGNMLIDAGQGGRYNSGEKVILPFLWQQGIREIDVVALTHPHEDHLGGIMPLLEKIKIDLILDTGQVHTSFLYQKFLELVDKKNIPFRIVHEGEELMGFKQVRILILNPGRLPLRDTDADLNNNSLVMKLIFGRMNFLFTGDIEKEAEERLMSFGSLLASQVMKVPHHGSSTSLYRPFLELVKPEAAIISCGYENPYGHPSPAALKAYQALKTKIYRTDKSGAIIIRSDGRSYRIKEMKVKNAGQKS